jgi:phosphatidylinositol phospholipase C delta
VKKPKFLLESGDGVRVFNPDETHPPKTTLKVKVISGFGWFERFGKTHFDRFSPPDFYTRVSDQFPSRFELCISVNPAS